MKTPGHTSPLPPARRSILMEPCPSIDVLRPARFNEGACEIQEPTIRQKAVATLRFLMEAHEQADVLYNACYGDENKGDTSREPNSLEDTLARTSELAAMLVGRLATINGRL